MCVCSFSLLLNGTKFGLELEFQYLMFSLMLRCIETKWELNDEVDFISIVFINGLRILDLETLLALCVHLFFL